MVVALQENEVAEKLEDLSGTFFDHEQAISDGICKHGLNQLWVVIAVADTGDFNPLEKKKKKKKKTTTAELVRCTS